MELDNIAKLIVSLNAVHVSEMYCPRRFTKAASRFGLIPGVAADLQEMKQDGTPWNLLDPDDEKEFFRLQDDEEPVDVSSG